MNTKSLGLKDLFLASILGFLFNGRGENVRFPKNLGTFKLVGKFNTGKKIRILSLALYENSKGEKAIGKMWKGSVKDLYYYTLKNELVIYKELNSALKRLNRSKSEEFSNVGIPKLLGFKETRNSLVILIEFIKGEVVRNLSVEKGFEIYLKSQDFLNFLGKNLNSKEKQNITQRSPKKFILLYFLLLFKALLTHPLNFKLLLSGVPIFLRSTLILFKKSKLKLAHRDLHLENIIVSQKKITLIDLQFCLFTHAMYDFINTLRLLWDNYNLRLKLLREIENRFGQTKEVDTLIRGLIVYSATQNLTDKRFPKSIVDSDLDYLHFAVKAVKREAKIALAGEYLRI